MKVENLYEVSVEIRGTDGQVHSVTCDKSHGWGSKAKVKKYRPVNGLESEVVLPGARSTENVTLTRLYDETIDAIAHWLYSQAGRAGVVVRRQPLDENGHPFGAPKVATGRLESFMESDTDSESEKESTCEFLCALNTNVG
jgi:hypothetical protein